MKWHYIAFIGTTVFSGYLLLNATLCRIWIVLEDALLAIPGNVVVARDFNAQAFPNMENAPHKHSRQQICQTLHNIGFVVFNQGSTPRCKGPSYGQSITDVTLVSESLFGHVEEWRVLGGFSAPVHLILPRLLWLDQQPKTRL